jgi:hypothetical protein
VTSRCNFFGLLFLALCRMAFMAFMIPWTVQRTRTGYRRTGIRIDGVIGLPRVCTVPGHVPLRGSFCSKEHGLCTLRERNWAHQNHTIKTGIFTFLFASLHTSPAIASFQNERKVGYRNAYLVPSRNTNPSSLPLLVPMLWNMIQDVSCFILSGTCCLTSAQPMISSHLSVAIRLI